MKVHQLLEDEDDRIFATNLLIKLIDKAGFKTSLHRTGSLRVDLSSELITSVHYEEDETWRLVVWRLVGAQPIIDTRNLSPKELLDAIDSAHKKYVLLDESLAHGDKIPLVWKLVLKLKSERRRVDFSGHVKGEIVLVDPKKGIEVYSGARYHIIPMRVDDDDRYDLEHVPPSIGPDSNPEDLTNPKLGYFRVIDQ